MESDLPTLDPLGLASFNDRNAGLLLYDTLLDIDAKGNIIPNIAERIDASEDVMTFKLTLRSGVKFSDGTPYDAAAVVKNFQRIMDPKNRCRCVSDLSTIGSLEATGPLEVVIKMKSPSAHFPAALADVAGMVASPAAVEKYGADFGNYGIGAGPFKLKEWRRGAQVIFERNPDYWRKPAVSRRGRAAADAGRTDALRQPARPATSTSSPMPLRATCSMRGRARNSRSSTPAASRPASSRSTWARRTFPTSACGRRWPTRSTA